MHPIRSATLVTALACACALVGGCGSSSPTSSSSAGQSSSATASASASANPALTVALNASDLPSGYTQSSDGLLGNTPNTDARVFSSADGITKVEVDLAADTSSVAAANDYSAYNTAAKNQVTATSSTSPSIGSKANEYAGTDSSNHSIVSLAFVRGSVIGVVTMVSTSGTVDPTVVETIAKTVITKVNAAKL